MPVVRLRPACLLGVGVIDPSLVSEAARRRRVEHLYIDAARRAIDAAGIAVGTIDGVIFCTASLPDGLVTTPSTYIGQRLGLDRFTCLELRGGCTASLYAVHVARALVNAGEASCVLVVAADSFSTIVDDQTVASRSSAESWRDGVGAILVGCEDARGRGLLVGASRFVYEGTLWNQTTLVPRRSQDPVTSRPLRIQIAPFPAGFAERDLREATTVILAVTEDASTEGSRLEGVIAPNRSKGFSKRLATNLGLPSDRVLDTYDLYGHLGSVDPVTNLQHFWTTVRGTTGRWALATCGYGFSWGAIALWSQ